MFNAKSWLEGQFIQSINRLVPNSGFLPSIKNLSLPQRAFSPLLTVILALYVLSSPSQVVAASGYWQLPIHEYGQPQYRIVGYALYKDDDLIGLVSKYAYKDANYSGDVSFGEWLFGDFLGVGQGVFVKHARSEHIRLNGSNPDIDIVGMEQMYLGNLSDVLYELEGLAVQHNYIQQVVGAFGIPWYLTALIDAANGDSVPQILVSQIGVPLLPEIIQDAILDPGTAPLTYRVEYRESTIEPIFTSADYVAAPSNTIFAVTNSLAPEDTPSALMWSVSPNISTQVFSDASGISNYNLSTTPVDKTIQPGSSVAVSALFPSNFWVDNDGAYDVTAFAIQDRTLGGGYLEVAGVPVPEATVYEFPISDLPNWSFVAANSSAVDEIGFNIIQADGDFSPRLEPGARVITSTGGGTPSVSAAVNPDPTDGSSNVSLSENLDWSNGGGAASYRVYFGEDSTPDSGEEQGVTSSSSYNLPTLDCDVDYYWRIDSINGEQEVTGPVWSFSTQSCVSGSSDLVVQNLAVETSTPYTNEEFEISLRVRNRGNSESPATTTRYYRSSDSNITTSDIELENESTRSLAEDEYDEEDKNVAIGVEGTFWVGACVDAVPGETSTSNNCSNGIQVTVADADVDVELTSVSVTDASPYSSFFEINATITNIGEAEVEDGILRYYLSYDQSIADYDIYIGRDNAQANNPGEIDDNTEVVAFNVPGTFWVGACIEPAESVLGGTETALGNNCSAGVEIVIPPPISSNQAGPIIRVSVNSEGHDTNDRNRDPAISRNGKYVAFESESVNLVQGDTNSEFDIFVRDIENATVERVSISSNGAEGDGDSYDPDISADGRYVVFRDESALVTSDTNNDWDVYLHDRVANTTKRVSVGIGGSEPDDGSGHPSISDDGRFVVFESSATNLVNGDTNGIDDIYLHDNLTNTISRLSVNSSNAQANGRNYDPVISGDGQFVAFYSAATNLVPGDGNDERDIFVKNLTTGAVEIVSISTSGTQANDHSYGPSISADGRYVVFHSRATNLVLGDTNGVNDVFRHDRQSRVTSRMSVSTSGGEGDSSSDSAVISDDGNLVVFESIAINLVIGDTNGLNDIFVRDVIAAETTRISMNEAQYETDGGSDNPSISGDGTLIAFESAAANLIDGDQNNVGDIYVYRVGSSTDTDGDGIIDSEDPDDDNDNWEDVYDNCPLDANPGQEDAEGDGVGDVCDNCLIISNPGQEDLDDNGVGDLCEHIGC